MKKTTIIKESKWIRSKTAGMYHSFFRPGEYIKKGEILELITGPFGDFETSMKCPSSGHIIAINNNPAINKGDALVHLDL